MFLLQNVKTGEYLTDGFVQWTYDEREAGAYEPDEVAIVSLWLATHSIEVSSVPV